MTRGSRDKPRWGEQVEGVRAVEHALAASRRRIETVYLARGAAKSTERIRDLAAEARVTVAEVDKGRISRMALSAVPQGVIAIGAPLPSVRLVEAAERAVDRNEYMLAFDGIEDPANMGAAIRTACALGAGGVLIPEHGAAGLTPSAMKAAAGAAEYVDLVPVKSLAKALAVAAKAGMWSVVLDSSGRPIYGQPLLGEPIVLVVGGEGSGVSRLVIERADLIASIPLAGAVESLNASAAVAAACSEICRIRGERV